MSDSSCSCSFGYSQDDRSCGDDDYYRSDDGLDSSCSITWWAVIYLIGLGLGGFVFAVILSAAVLSPFPNLRHCLCYATGLLQHVLHVVTILTLPFQCILMILSTKALGVIPKPGDDRFQARKPGGFSGRFNERTHHEIILQLLLTAVITLGWPLVPLAFCVTGKNVVCMACFPQLLKQEVTPVVAPEVVPEVETEVAQEDTQEATPV